MVRACLAGMSVGYVKTARIACVPIRIPLHEVRVRRGLDMLHWGWCRIISSARGLCRRVPWCPSCCDCCEGGSPSGSKTRRASTASPSTSASLPTSLPAASGEAWASIRSSRPMPKRVDFEDLRLPASYANFLILNNCVLVPTFNDSNDRVALNILSECFPDREVIGISCIDFI